MENHIFYPGLSTFPFPCLTQILPSQLLRVYIERVFFLRETGKSDLRRLRVHHQEVQGNKPGLRRAIMQMYTFLS